MSEGRGELFTPGGAHGACRVICVSLALGVSVFAGIAGWMQSAGAAPTISVPASVYDMLLVGNYVLLGAMTVGAWVVRSTRLRALASESEEAERMHGVFTACVAGYAMIEGAGLLGAIGCLLLGPEFLTIAVLSAGLILIQWPKREWFEVGERGDPFRRDVGP